MKWPACCLWIHYPLRHCALVFCDNIFLICCINRPLNAEQTVVLNYKIPLFWEGIVYIFSLLFRQHHYCLKRAGATGLISYSHVGIVGGRVALKEAWETEYIVAWGQNEVKQRKSSSQCHLTLKISFSLFLPSVRSVYIISASYIMPTQPACILSSPFERCLVT